MQETQLAGQIALYQTLHLCGPPPHTQSHIQPREMRRRTVVEPNATREYYPPSYAPGPGLRENLRFAFKYEALDLRTLHAGLTAMGVAGVRQWVQEEPTGRYSRLAWFFYERLTGDEIDLPPTTNAPLVSALDPARHLVAHPRSSPRHRVRDNLLGGPELCLTIRRTPSLQQAMGQDLAERIRTITARYSADMLRRATDYLYTRETRSSFDIEGEPLNDLRAERFLQALRGADTFDPTQKSALIGLQQSILDERFSATDWRATQVYVGTRRMRGRQNVHFICPRPTDIPSLMSGFYELATRCLASPDLDPIAAATAVAFAFVFIHPFDDGNGRTHRFLIHNVLSRRGFTPEGMIFPVSAALLRDQEGYYRSLDGFSLPIKPCIDWEFYGEDEIAVHNDTRNLYRFFDATHLAEYLYAKVEETIRVDFQQELDYLAHYDAAFTAIQRIVDMPDKDLSLMVRLCLQNEGRLSKSKRSLFPLLRDNEVARIEAAVQSILEG